jgi:hypothetical protein
MRSQSSTSTTRTAHLHSRSARLGRHEHSKVDALPSRGPLAQGPLQPAANSVHDRRRSWRGPMDGMRHVGDGWWRGGRRVTAGDGDDRAGEYEDRCRLEAQSSARPDVDMNGPTRDAVVLFVNSPACRRLLLTTLSRPKSLDRIPVRGKKPYRSPQLRERRMKCNVATFMQRKIQSTVTAQSTDSGDDSGVLTSSVLWTQMQVLGHEHAEDDNPSTHCIRIEC